MSEKPFDSKTFVYSITIYITISEVKHLATLIINHRAMNNLKHSQDDPIDLTTRN